jgi:hypothetical protein
MTLQKKYNLYIKVDVIKKCGECEHTHTEKVWQPTQTSEGRIYQYDTPREAWLSIMGSYGVDINKGEGEQEVVGSYGKLEQYKVLSNI